MKTIQSLFSYLKTERAVLVFVVILVLIQVTSSLVAPRYIGIWIDALSRNMVNGETINLSLLSVILMSYLVGGLSSWLQNYMVAGSTQRIMKRVRGELFQKSTKQPLSFYDLNPHGDTMSRLTNDVELMCSALNDGFLQLISGILMLVSAFILMLMISLPLTFATLLILPLIALLTQTITKVTRPVFKQQQQAIGQLTGIIDETLTGLTVVQAFGQEEKMKEAYSKQNQALYDTGLKAQIWTGLLMPLMNVINNLSYAVIGFFGGVLVLNRALTIGQLTSFINYSRYLIRPINEIASTYASFMSSLAGAERVLEMLDLPDEDSPPQLFSLTGESGGCIEFLEVSFGYNAENCILDSVSFRVDPGKKIALVGPTGAGKTTIASLLSGFYTQTSGEILIDGKPLKNYSRQSLSHGFAIVLQDSYLFEDTIMNNIRYGRMEATDQEVIEAAKKAHAHGFIQRLHKDYQHLLSQGGDNLSSGEKQLISIARAMLVSPLILILDEATSSVDTGTEKEVQKALHKLMKNRTSLIIAHRLSTIRDADEIIYVVKGKIIERGSHEALMDQKGQYYQQYVHQFEGFEE